MKNLLMLGFTNFKNAEADTIKESVKEQIERNFKEDNLKIKADWSKSGKTLKGYTIYNIGSKGKLYYVDLMSGQIKKLYRKKVTETRELI